MSLAYSRAAFGALAGVLVCGVVFAVAVGRARRPRVHWHIADKWRTLADMSMLAGASLAACAVVMVGMAAMSGT